MKKTGLVVLIIFFSILIISCANKITKIEVEEALKNSHLQNAAFIAQDFTMLEQETLEEDVYSVRIEFISQRGTLKEYILIVNTMAEPMIETYDY